MKIGFIIMCIICTALNIFLLKKENKKKFIIYGIGIVILNSVYSVVTLLGNSLAVNDFFDLFSVNMLMYLSVCDIYDMQLPYIAFAIYGVVGIVACIFGDFIITILFTAVIFTALWIASKKSKESIGKGDVYAISCVALFNSTANTMSIIVISLVLSLIYGIINSIIRKTGMKTVVAYIPFLFSACYLINLIY